MSLLDELKKADKEIEEVSVTAPQVKPSTLKQAISNIPSSTLQLGKDIIQPIIAPVEFLKSTYSLGKGVIELAIPGEQPDEKQQKLWASIWLIDMVVWKISEILLQKILLVY